MLCVFFVACQRVVEISLVNCSQELNCYEICRLLSKFCFDFQHMYMTEQTRLGCSKSGQENDTFYQKGYTFKEPQETVLE